MTTIKHIEILGEVRLPNTPPPLPVFRRRSRQVKSESRLRSLDRTLARRLNLAVDNVDRQYVTVRGTATLLCALRAAHDGELVVVPRV